MDSESPDTHADQARMIARMSNANIRAFADGDSPETLWEFFCECGCYTLVETPLQLYDGVAEAAS